MRKTSLKRKQFDSELSSCLKGLSELLQKDNILGESVSGFENELSKLKGEVSAVVNSISLQNMALAAGNAEMNSYNERSVTIDDECLKAGERILSLKDQIRGLQKELTAALESIDSANNSLSGYRRKIDIRKQNVTQIEDRVKKLEYELSDKRSRLNMLKGMEKEYEGFGSSVKTVIIEGERGRLKNIHGPVSRLIKTDEKYSVAIEVALGGAAQDIVVENEEDAKAAIYYLKAKDLGRATFLPITSVKGSGFISGGLEKMEGYIGLASKLVKNDGRYDGIVNFLLGRVVVADTLENAIKISRSKNGGLRIVTLDGQIMNVGGSMTGGSTNKRTGFFTRANEIESLEKEVMELNASLDGKIYKSLSDAKEELKQIQYEMEFAENERINSEQEKIRINTNIGNLSAQADEFSLSLTNLENTKQENISRIEQLKDSISETEKKISELSSSLNIAEGEILRLEGGHSDIIEKRELLSQDIMARRLKINSLENEIKAISRQIESDLNLKKMSANESLTRRQEIEAIRQTISDYLKQADEYDSLILDHSKGLSTKKELITSLAQAKMSIEAEIANKKKESHAQRDLLFRAPEGIYGD